MSGERLQDHWSSGFVSGRHVWYHFKLLSSLFVSIFTSDFGKLPVPLHLGKDKYFFHYIWENIHKIGKNKAIFGLGMPPVTGGKTSQIKSVFVMK